jgi:hypothetical protein
MAIILVCPIAGKFLSGRRQDGWLQRDDGGQAVPYLLKDNEQGVQKADWEIVVDRKQCNKMLRFELSEFLIMEKSGEHGAQFPKK